MSHRPTLPNLRCSTRADWFSPPAPPMTHEGFVELLLCKDPLLASRSRRSMLLRYYGPVNDRDTLPIDVNVFAPTSTHQR